MLFELRKINCLVLMFEIEKLVRGILAFFVVFPFNTINFYVGLQRNDYLLRIRTYELIFQVFSMFCKQPKYRNYDNQFPTRHDIWQN